jgi:hypothetical protein
MRQSPEGQPDVQAMGVIARLSFVDDSGKEKGTARLYLPHGLLVLSSPASRAGRFPVLNASVLQLLKMKHPDYLAELEDALRSHGYTVDGLTEARAAAPSEAKPAPAKP